MSASSNVHFFPLRALQWFPDVFDELLWNKVLHGNLFAVAHLAYKICEIINND